MVWKLPKTILGALAAALVAGGAMPAPAQTFPGSKAITVIVPYAPGGTTDTAARLMAAALETELKGKVQVVNRAGAASQVGMTELVRAAPDGYTLAYAVLPTVTTHYLDKSRQSIYTRESFQPVALHFFTPAMIAVRTDSPYKSIKDLVAAAKEKPGTIKISDSGLMAVPHIQVVMLERAAGVTFASVHFTGGAPSVTALLGGHVDALAGGISDALPHMKAGTFRVLGVASDEPDPAMPDVPTTSSQGFDVMAASWTGILAPAGTPKAVVDTLTAAVKRIVDSAAHRQKLDEMGVAPRYLTPEAYTKAWIDIEARMKPVMDAPAK
ncbi:MAG: tripartite tricarboxylate transporter substrate binding protein [Alphaproteobacteria bacterium]|nr:tripartite tricarboxylate transporter substrate binding protein [Alphaproteobacteria bacterium]